jgi:hypothetical protein
MKDLKILCVCRSGNVRSVATKYCLNRKFYDDVIAVGCDKVSRETLRMLCEWADLILLAKPDHGKKIGQQFKHKINKGFTIGEDTYGSSVNLKLMEVVEYQLVKIGL